MMFTSSELNQGGSNLTIYEIIELPNFDFLLAKARLHRYILNLRNSSVTGGINYTRGVL